MIPYRKSPQGMWIWSFCAPFQKRAEPLVGLRRCACVGGVVSAHTRACMAQDAVRRCFPGRVGWLLLWELMREEDEEGSTIRNRKVMGFDLRSGVEVVCVLN